MITLTGMHLWTRAQLRASMSDATISRRFIRVLPGVYGDGDPGFVDRCRAVGLWRPDAVLARRTAGHLYGWLPEPELVDVIVSRRTRTPPWLRAREGSARSAFLSDFRVTTPAHTVVDCAADLDDGAAGKLVDECIAAGLTVSAIRAELRRGVRHSARVRRLVDTAARNFASEPERLLIRALAGRGYRLEANARVGRFVVDLLDRRARVIVEVDGLEFHSAQDVFRRDRVRQNALLLSGFLVLRYAAYDVLRNPDAVAAEIIDVVRRRRRSLA